jgi:hypothetical protein
VAPGIKKENLAFSLGGVGKDMIEKILEKNKE